MMQQQHLTPPLLQVEGLRKWYPLGGGWLGKPAQSVKAVNGVSFEIRRGEVLSLVGESGSGKSTIGRAILNLDPPTAGRCTSMENPWWVSRGARCGRCGARCRWC